MTAVKNPFLGTWLITEMSEWGDEYFNEQGQAYITIGKNFDGAFLFGSVQGEMDCELVKGHLECEMAFSWQGNDEEDEASGRGWFKLTTQKMIEGRIFIHMGENSTFKAVKK